MSTSSKVSEQFLHPFIVGLVSIAGSYASGESGKVAQIGGISLSLPVFQGIVTGLSSTGGETLKQWVLPMLPNNAMYSNMESTFLSPVLVGVTNGVAMHLLTKTRGKERFVLGAGSEIAGSYLYDGVIKNYIR
jgi:hypothetical protein